jgi:hypothetical protein
MGNSDEVIAKLFKDFLDNRKYLEDNSQISLLIDYKDNISKVLLLCMASSFEEQIVSIIHRGLKTDENALAREFLKNKALNRQYHTLFNWTASNANQFFGLFGSDFKKSMEMTIRADDKLQDAIRDFLFLGNKRNEMVHENYALFLLDDTTEELYDKYISAKYFLEVLARELGSARAS